LATGKASFLPAVRATWGEMPQVLCCSSRRFSRREWSEDGLIKQRVISNGGKTGLFGGVAYVFRPEAGAPAKLRRSSTATATRAVTGKEAVMGQTGSIGRKTRPAEDGRPQLRLRPAHGAGGYAVIAGYDNWRGFRRRARATDRKSLTSTRIDQANRVHKAAGPVPISLPPPPAIPGAMNRWLGPWTCTGRPSPARGTNSAVRIYVGRAAASARHLA